jgi:hypothetical protein
VREAIMRFANGFSEKQQYFFLKFDYQFKKHFIVSVGF